mmetsp:Transcript_18867/g.58077  ORF Transcript_18867/g.58077 Transcript_18867/m.58077 type:complete len:487 (-) Transcript_18867:1755-3215(-)
MSLVDFADPVAAVLADYSNDVRDALDIRDGPSHMEIKVDPDSWEPCLVEVGARCHGGEGSWSSIARACVGYDQVDATLDAFSASPKKFNALPTTPPALAKFGAEVFFVTRVAGMVRSTDKATACLTQLPSYHALEWHVKPGDFAALTTDCFTRPGSVQLIHADPTVLKRDYDRLQKGISLDLEFVCSKPIDRGTVVVVDPYSSGAILAQRVRTKHRKNLIVVHSDPDSPIASLVATGTSVTPKGTVTAPSSSFDGGGGEDSSSFADVVATQVLEQAAKSCIVAAVPGAETGVILADELALRLGTRVNAPALSSARRNKFLMGEAVRRAGVRAVRQCKARTWADAEAFLRTEEEALQVQVPDETSVRAPSPQKKKKERLPAGREADRERRKRRHFPMRDRGRGAVRGGAHHWQSERPRQRERRRSRPGVPARRRVRGGRRVERRRTQDRGAVALRQTLRQRRQLRVLRHVARRLRGPRGGRSRRLLQ